MTEKGCKDTCHGDSGGPLLCDGGKVIIGVISTGMGCGIPYRSASYAKVESFLPFISEAMKRTTGFRWKDEEIINAGGERSSLWNVVDVLLLLYVTITI
ncbi:Trypsin domain containing protein [Asbolus verrucosus]|uniref:Trypsin domain containing protein n=1 Tax=Asbolus verrucosus TaxID=1661398 RepID=A0A482WAU5_ASBVE|nr:Trypsin domain containing protein [Asbolus verrucosus]